MIARTSAFAFTLVLATVAMAQTPTPTPMHPRTPAEGVVVGGNAEPEAGGGVVYGAHHAFTISAPPAWVLDTQAGVRDGLHAVLYRQGESYAGSPGIMYARGEDFATGAAPTLDAYIASDLVAMHKESPDVQASELPAIALRDGTLARVVGYRGDKWGNVEAVAYFSHGDSIVVLALSARTQARFDADIEDFRRLVADVMPMDGGSGEPAAAARP